MTEMTITTEGFLDEALQLVRDTIDALIDEGPSSPDPVQWSMLCGECLDIADELLIAGAVDLNARRGPRGRSSRQLLLDAMNVLDQVPEHERPLSLLPARASLAVAVMRLDDASGRSDV